MDKPLTLFDKRIAERSVRKGDITQAEFDEFIQTLPDRVDDAEPLELEEEIQAAPAPPPEAGEAVVPPAESDAPEASASAPEEPAAPEDEAEAPLPEQSPEQGAEEGEEAPETKEEGL